MTQQRTLKGLEKDFEGGIPDNEESDFEEPDQNESPGTKAKKKGVGLTNEQIKKYAAKF